jgi:hypothetical protein
VNLFHGAKDASSQEGRSSAKTTFGSPLVAHLRDHFFLGRNFAKASGFADVVGQWLLTKTVKAHVDRHRGKRGVHVIGRADCHSVDLLAHLFEHLAKVAKLLRLGKPSPCTFKLVLIDITNRDNISMLTRMARIASTFTIDANTTKVDFFVRRISPNLRSNATRNPEANPRRRGSLQKVTTIISACHRKILHSDNGIITQAEK